MPTPRPCANPACNNDLPVRARKHARTCSTRCRVAVHRLEAAAQAKITDESGNDEDRATVPE